VLDDEMQVFAGEEDYTAGPGTVAVLPGRLRHAYVVTSATARFLTLHTPAGFEQFAAEVGEPAQALTLPPGPTGPPDFALEPGQNSLPPAVEASNGRWPPPRWRIICQLATLPPAAAG
jgi:hypothetical protein